METHNNTHTQSANRKCWTTHTKGYMPLHTYSHTNTSVLNHPYFAQAVSMVTTASSHGNHVTVVKKKNELNYYYELNDF